MVSTRMEDRTPFAALLVARRKAMKLSQEALGDRLGKSQSAVSAWENGTNGIALAEFYPVARALGMSDAEIAEAVKLASEVRPDDAQAEA
jgi:transcriptional regulator with XRE-family HTH domain